MPDRTPADHLKRAAIVYVRQSSPEQVRNHAESTRIQVGLRDKAVAFGWRDPVTILDDLGISAGGRPPGRLPPHGGRSLPGSGRHHPVLPGLPPLAPLPRRGPAVPDLRGPPYPPCRSPSGL